LAKKKLMEGNCFCCSNKLFSQCCEPLLLGKEYASHPEQLMQSRFSAYKTENYRYIVTTYASQQKQDLDTPSIRNGAAGTKWLSLEIISSNKQSEHGQVEFKAYYQVDNHYYVLHEASEFILEEQQWRYTKGKILSDGLPLKIGRNDPCPCGSHKKYKKCCCE
jgi:SEC-C motif-containing protein